MNEPKEIPLDAWAAAKFSPAPSIYTLRRWAREAKIFPLPRKYGREYRVKENARYIDHNDPNYAQAVAETIYESTETQ